jgi:hypothetical protein
MTMTVISDTVQGPDHDCGGDHRSKLGCYGVYVEPSFPNRSIQCAFFCSSGSSRSRGCVIRNFIVSSKVQVNQARGQDTCRSLPRPRIFSKEICFSTRENNNNHEFP